MQFAVVVLHWITLTCKYAISILLYMRPLSYIGQPTSIQYKAVFLDSIRKCSITNYHRPESAQFCYQF